MRGIEGLPFRYVVLALVAVLVVGFVIQFTNTTTKGLSDISGKLIDQVEAAEESKTDVVGPTIGSLTTSPFSWETCFEVKVKDPSGVSFVSVKFDNKEAILDYEGTRNGWELWGKCIQNYDHGEKTVSVLAIDNSANKNYNTRIFSVEV